MTRRISKPRWSVVVMLSIWSGFCLQMAAQTSFNGRYRLSSELSGRVTEDPRQERTRTYELRDSSGRFVGRILRAIPYDVPSPIPAVLDDGHVILIHTYDDIIEIFEPSGELLKRVPLQATPTPDYERIVKVAPHGDFLTLGISEADGSAVEVLSVGASGNIRRTMRIADARITGIALDQLGTMSAVATESWDGPVLRSSGWFIPSVGAAWNVDGGWSNGVFSEGDPSRFLGWSGSGAHYVDLSSKRLLWSKTATVDEIFIDAAFDGEGALVLSAKKPAFTDRGWEYREAGLTQIAADGTVLSVVSVKQGNFQKARIKGAPGSRYVNVDGVIVR